MNDRQPSPTQHTLQALAQESVCLQALVEAGYHVDQAARWLDTWVGADAQGLWADGNILAQGAFGRQA